MYPLVRELAGDGIPVTVTCRVLKIARQPYYRWLANPVTDAELATAYRANALFDAHGEDPEFGYRFLVDEARDAGEPMAERTVWKICSELGWWSAFGKKRGRNGKKPGPPVHDDLVMRDFTAEAPNTLWLADIQCRRRHFRSATHSWSVPAGTSQPRWTRSGCRRAVVSRRVVVVRCRPRTAPAIPAIRISRATWSRPTSIPARRAALWSLRAP